MRVRALGLRHTITRTLAFGTNLLVAFGTRNGRWEGPKVDHWRAYGRENDCGHWNLPGRLGGSGCSSRTKCFLAWD